MGAATAMGARSKLRAAEKKCMAGCGRATRELSERDRCARVRALEAVAAVADVSSRAHIKE